MEDEITKRELSDDELDNVSGGGCEENARNCCPQCGSTEAKTIFSREDLSLIHISEPTRQAEISYAVFCLKKKKQ